MINGYCHPDFKELENHFRSLFVSGYETGASFAVEKDGEMIVDLWGGFKDKEKALHTVKVIKNRDLKCQVNVIATMLGRAKKHPYKTQNMKDAIKVFSLWMKDYKKNRRA